MPSVQVYDLNRNKVLRLPSSGQAQRLSILLFYVNGCTPSRMHLDYFSTYASSHRSQVTIHVGISHPHPLVIVPLRVRQLLDSGYHYPENAGARLEGYSMLHGFLFGRLSL